MKYLSLPALVLVFMMLLSLGAKQDPQQSGTSEEGGGGNVSDSTEAGKGFSEFDSELISFLEKSGMERESFMVSPTSYRAALALAVSGANGETKEQLLHAMGFQSEEEMNAWYQSVLDSVAFFGEDLNNALKRFEEDEWLSDGEKPDRAFSIANSVWHNAGFDGSMSPKYIERIRELYRAEAADVPAEQLTKEVNDWVNRQTAGLIPSIAGDLSDTEAVLVNALYLRTSWISSFSEYATETGEFTDIDGSKTEKEFMRHEDDYLYYEDSGCQAVVLPMEGGICAAFVLGDGSNIAEKLSKATWEDVVVRLPKFEIESSFSNGELVDFLKAHGATLPLSGQADFSAMCEDFPWCISDIIQKSKIKVDEDGIEAAAVTAILMETTSAFVEDPPQPKYFNADRPFSFYLFTGNTGSGELLFYGQLVK